MVRYRRVLAAGGTFFFTVALRNRRANTLVAHIELLRQAIDHTRDLRPFHIDAMVVLPEHLHAMWTMPEGDTDYSGRWRSIKSGFVRALPSAGVELTTNARGECDLWQRRFWEHQIRDEEDLQRHVDYIHINPVKHGLVQHVIDWPWSSFHRYVRDGLLARDWACAPGDLGRYGE
jgi:putative transposase